LALSSNLLGPLKVPHPDAFGPLWSLAVEEQFYLVWPIAVYLLSERRLAKLAICLIILAPILRAVFHFPDYQTIYELTPFRMDLLAAGALLCVIYRKRPVDIERWGPSLGLLFMALGLGGLLTLGHFGITTSGNTRIGNVWIFECALAVSWGVMLWALSGRNVRFMQWGPLTFIGEISFTMYLVHVGVLAGCSKWLSGYTAAVAAFAVTVGYATLSWYVIERPLLAHGRNLRALAPSTA
jgi:peptidoglycan/LPS O-acetylase OafA/YrhL